LDKEVQVGKDQAEADGGQETPLLPPRCSGRAVSDPVVIKIDGDKVVRWLRQGAQPTEAARSLLKREGILERLAETRKSTASA
jgi:ribosomal protein S16